MPSSSDAQVAILIDFENIQKSVQEHYPGEYNVEWGRILEEAALVGRAVIRRAYADWKVYGTQQREMLGMGIELVHVTGRSQKNAADIRIAIDALELMYRSPQISHFLLVSGDGDFTALVHKLHEHGKIVLGLGVQQSSADYLIKVCDRFIFYGTLLDRGPASTASDKSLDVSDARQMVRRVLRSAAAQEWSRASWLKNMLLSLNPAFNERNYGFDALSEFLRAQQDLVELREPSDNSGDLEVRLRPPESGAVARALAPLPGQPAAGATLELYQEILEKRRLRMSPSEDRPLVIRTAFELFRKNPYTSLSEKKDELHRYFEDQEPSVKWETVNDVIYQLFYTFCFEFDKGEHYDEQARLWDRTSWLRPVAQDAAGFLQYVDRRLLLFLALELGGPGGIDPDLACRLLYGREHAPEHLETVQNLIESLWSEFRDEWHQNARHLAVQAYQLLPPERRTGSAMKATMTQLDPTFNERDRQYLGFAQFLAAQNDLFTIIRDPTSGDFRVIRRSDRNASSLPHPV
ncbi:MAG: NYN domain-containing protein [Ardenticatenaceae bacterium]|nr:NYN domain-containing protein [Ardenticatenaceae bacterium]